MLFGFIIMAVGIFLSIIMKLPAPDRYKRDHLYNWKKQSMEIIECESSSWWIWILRGIFLVIMILATVDCYECENFSARVPMYAVYAVAFFLHYIAWIELDRKYYITESGLWVGKADSELIRFQDVRVLRIWKTAVPLTGCHGSVKVRIKTKRRQYVMLLPEPDDEESGNGCDEVISEQEKVLQWLPNPEKKEAGIKWKKTQKHAGVVIIIAGISMFLIFGGLTIRGTGAGMQSSNKSGEPSILQKEQALHGMADAALENADGTLYVLFEDFACINVYGEDHAFRYAYKVPEGERGSIRFAVRGSHVYIKNRDDTVYVYHGRQFEEELPLNEAMEKREINFVEDGQGLEKVSAVRSSGMFDGDEALPYMLLGIPVCLFGGFLYNRGRYSVSQWEH